MNTFIKYFGLSAAVTALAVVLAYFFIGGIAAVSLVLLLGVLETSLSFDNAVVNATKLKDMNERGRKWFIHWGMLIAVFGMRLVFPIAIVAIIAKLSPWAVVGMAISRPAEYAAILTSSHHVIAAFGGAFLFMVFLKFMFDEEKDSHWLGWLEAPLAKAGSIDMVQSLVTIGLVVLTATMLIPAEGQVGFLTAGLAGWASYVLVEGLGNKLEAYDEAHGSDAKQVLSTTLRAALPGLLYLEVLDASMSFDGVIGAFALSTNIFVIMLGLGIGAMFVRSLTILLVEKGTLTEFRYLEHGAFWAIGALASTMFLGTYYHLPEWFIGSIGALAIGAALISSVMANRKEAGEEVSVDVAKADGSVIRVTDADL